MSTSNCVNDDRIVNICDMTGGLHIFNIGNEETFEMLGEKVKEKLQLEKHKYNIYFFNREGTEKKKKNDKVDIVNSEVDSEPDFRFIVDMIKPIPICVEENEVYDIEIVRTIEHNYIIEEEKNGFLVNERSATKLADKIELLINNEKLYAKISKTSFESSKKYNIANYVDKLVEMYKSK